ncbi:MAG: DNA polymerase I [Campylobacterota bacterium]
MKKTITIIDTFGFLFRSYYALPPLKSSTGFPTGLLTGFMNLISNIGKDFQTDYLVFALDSKGNTFRNEIYEEYKSHRPDVPEDLLAQLPVAIDWISKMGFEIAIKDGFEADDLIASIAHDAKQKDLEVRIVSHDKDLYQLIEDDRVYLFDPIKKTVINEKHCFEKYGIHPHQFTDYQSLLGDSADNVPGVKGVGAKTAQALIQEYGTLENIYENLESIEKTRWKNLLTQGKEMAFTSKKLVTLSHDCHCIDDIETYILPLENPILKIEDILIEYDMNAIVQRVHKNGLNYKTEIPKKSEKKEPTNNNYNYILLNSKDELFKIINSIPKDSIVAFDTETTSIDSKSAKIIGFSFAFEENRAYYAPVGHFYLGVLEQIDIQTCKEAIAKLNNFKLVAQNFKYDYEIIRRNLNIELKLYADTMILAWMLDTAQKVGLDAQAKRYFNHEMIAFKDIVKKGEDFSNVEIQKACDYAAEDALITLKLYHKLIEEFKSSKNEKLLQIAFDYEFDFIYVLANMEQHGIKIDTKQLEVLKEKNSKHIKSLEDKIYEQAGEKFNINSTKQLGVILFEKLNLPVIKKTKTGYSTNEVVLHKLKNEHEIIKLLLDYREAFKLESTYVEPLLKLAISDKENKVYTTFLHNGTATGRLSSKNPNLQNIPVRSEAGQLIRKAFIPQDGYKLVGIDYSQIELRLLAHFSEDEALIDGFKHDLDIHRQTAVKIFGEDKADKNRAIAKSINFGLLYGMGSRKLADTLGIKPKEAKQYIDTYFEVFKSVKNYLKEVEEKAYENGYVKTLIERKRFFDFNSANGMQRAAYLRESVNTLFQGSAADLIKLSMIEIYKKYNTNKNINTLLQIHDELIFEIKEEKIEEISKDLKEIMENIYKLKVPLKVSVSQANSWQGLK